ncbi:MAG TPA: Uma2 family endonuclease [Pirellulaceae bacterium]|nr:Uma2 family endonuclease [Planctomycetales bacterium]MCB9940484.1 Uma2 family endonuclease [Planctomycetaceae bacterium]HRX78013.1 Uma2 family endonuclease [Pirellulaceae bacterium]
MSQAIPANTKLGYEHYVCYPDDGRRHEIIDGDHYMNPAPTTDHQRFSRRIQFQLYEQIEESGRGEVFNAPSDVQLTDHDIVQPDLIIVMHERRSIITPSRIIGVPNLIVEILSPTTKRHDCVLKKALYERVGVPEYWIVLTDDRAVEQFVLRDGKYVLEGNHSSSMTVATIENVSVDLTKVW